MAAASAPEPGANVVWGGTRADPEDPLRVQWGQHLATIRKNWSPLPPARRKLPDGKEIEAAMFEVACSGIHGMIAGSIADEVMIKAHNPEDKRGPGWVHRVEVHPDFLVKGELRENHAHCVHVIAYDETRAEKEKAHAVIVNLRTGNFKQDSAKFADPKLDSEKKPVRAYYENSYTIAARVYLQEKHPKLFKNNFTILGGPKHLLRPVNPPTDGEDDPPLITDDDDHESGGESEPAPSPRQLAVRRRQSLEAFAGTASEVMANGDMALITLVDGTQVILPAGQAANFVLSCSAAPQQSTLKAADLMPVEAENMVIAQLRKTPRTVDDIVDIWSGHKASQHAALMPQCQGRARSLIHKLNKEFLAAGGKKRLKTFDGPGPKRYRIVYA